MLEDTINFGGGDLPKLTLNNLPQPVEHGLLISVHEELLIKLVLTIW
jgi:hypothetical protein